MTTAVYQIIKLGRGPDERPTIIAMTSKKSVVKKLSISRWVSSSGRKCSRVKAWIERIHSQLDKLGIFFPDKAGQMAEAK
jgi:hypothetical protein